MLKKIVKSPQFTNNVIRRNLTSVDAPSKITMGSWKNKIVASCLQEERDKQDFTIGQNDVFGVILDKNQWEKHF